MNEEEKKAVDKAIYELEDSYELHQREWAKKCLNTIKHGFTKLQKENEELKEINEQLSENKLLQDIEIKKKFIPIQKVKDKIEEIQEEGYWLFTTDRDSDKCVEVLQELLEK